MIDFLWTFLGALSLPRSKGSFPRERLPPLPRHATERMPFVANVWRLWASGMPTVSAEPYGYRAVVGGKPVRIHTGLDGSAPRSVVVEIEAAHDAPTVLVTDRAGDDAHPTVQRVSRALFDDPWLLPIRSIAFAPGIIRIRLRPLTEPEVVVHIVGRFAKTEPPDALLPNGQPYR